MLASELKPKSFPSDVLQKDWAQRKIYNRVVSQDFANKLHDFEVREDDIWIVTLPKCGTTWMQELVWLLVNDFDFERAKSEPLEVRSPAIESAHYYNGDIDEWFENLAKMKSPRVIKTHFPLPLLPKQLWIKKPKVIYVFRDPKDAIVSLYYHVQTFGMAIDLSLAEFVEMDLNQELATNSLVNHVLEFYELRNEPWIHYTSFERLKRNLRTEIEDVCKFLNITIVENQMVEMLKHLSFEEMKNNPQCNHIMEIEAIRKRRGTACTYKDSRFLRKGEIGTHKKELPAVLIQRLDQWITGSLRPYNLNLNDLLLL